MGSTPPFCTLLRTRFARLPDYLLTVVYRELENLSNVQLREYDTIVNIITRSHGWLLSLSHIKPVYNVQIIRELEVSLIFQRKVVK